jgi:predicted GH43/DUF377 family glycosyl hydrolase
MLLVIPVSAHDLSLACLNLRLAAKLDAKCPFHCLISAPKGLDVTELYELVKRWSSVPTLLTYEDWTGDKAWPRPQNWAWQTAARLVVGLRENPHWFWWEADATPIKSGWFKTLDYFYSAGGRPFAGHIVTGQGNGHLNGVAIYPPDVGSFAPAAFLARSQPFDRVLSQHIGERQITPLNHLIGHYLKPPGREGFTVTSATDAAPILNSEMVLFHGSSDGSLARYLLDPASFPAKSAVSVSNSIPSFTEQTKWESGYFTFPAAGNTVYFNPGVCERDGVPHLFTRRWRYSQKDPHWKGSDNTSDLAIWRINDNMTLANTPIIPRLPLRHPSEQWEDPRVVVGQDGVARVSFVTWTHKKPWPFHQVFARLSADWSQVEGVLEPTYGNNTPNHQIPSGPEKNWTWFEHDSVWHCRYGINPSDVFSITAEGKLLGAWHGKEVDLPWKHSAPLRGGTPPVSVGSEYVTFFHSHLPWNGTRRRYFMGALAFEAKPPFALTRITRTPILSGSTQDMMGLPNALPCIFPSGAIIRDDKWLVTFGVNDEACGWIKIPRRELDKLLVKI